MKTQRGSSGSKSKKGERDRTAFMPDDESLQALQDEFNAEQQEQTPEERAAMDRAMMALGWRPTDAANGSSKPSAG